MGGKLVRRERVQHLAPADPGAARDRDGPAQIPEVARGVRVRRQHERNAALSRSARVDRIEVEPVRIAVDLDRGARLADRVEDFTDPDLDRTTVP